MLKYHTKARTSLYYNLTKRSTDPTAKLLYTHTHGVLTDLHTELLITISPSLAYWWVIVVVVVE